MIDRPKQGFGVPVYEWFFEKLGVFAKRELTEFCLSTDFLDERALQGMFQAHAGKQLWFLLNFALWHKHFIAGSGD